MTVPLCSRQFILSLIVLIFANAKVFSANSCRTILSESGTFVIDSGTQGQHRVGKGLQEKIRTLQSVSGLKILWWNIANGELSAAGEIERNINQLIASRLKPDIVAFAEVPRKLMTDSLMMFLKDHYPYHYFLSYNEKMPDLGIIVFSVTVMESKSTEILEWVPSNLGRAEKETYLRDWTSNSEGDAFYSRSISDLTLNYKGKTISFIPVHLAQPWRHIRENSSNKGMGIILTLKELFLGRINPLMTQIHHLLGWLRESVGENAIVIGDFNLPKGFSGFHTKGFRKIEGQLKSAFQHNSATFPAVSSPLHDRYPQVQIDHAFTQGQLEVPAIEVLPLKGSDHLPIFGVFDFESTQD